MLNQAEAIRSLQHTGKEMTRLGLAWGNAGNLSARIGQDRYLITASGTNMGELADDDFVECAFSGEWSHPERRKPSKEMPMHRAIYETRPEVHAVLHASPFHSTLAACSKVSIPSGLFVETMYYLERIERVPYFHPGSPELGEAVRSKAKQANVLLLENHGILVYDVSVKEAFMAMQTLEMACRMTIAAEAGGFRLSPLDPATVQSFLNDSGYRPRRSWET